MAELDSIMATARQQMEGLKPTLVDIANSVKEIDEKLESVKGGDTLNQSTVLTQAVANQGEGVSKSITKLISQVQEKGGEYLAAFYKIMTDQLKETVRPAVNSYVDEVNSANQVADTGIDPDALRKQRSELMSNFRAMKAAFAAYPDIDLSDVPEPKRIGGGRKKGSLTKKDKGAVFYVNGEKFVSFAQAASKATADMENVGRGKEFAPTAYLRSILKANNIPSTADSPYKKAWEVKLDNGVVVKSELTGQAETEAETTETTEG